MIVPASDEVLRAELDAWTDRCAALLPDVAISHEVTRSEWAELTSEERRAYIDRVMPDVDSLLATATGVEPYPALRSLANHLQPGAATR